MPASAFSHVCHWVFDLDHTLYPPSARLFDQIEVRMTAYVMRALGVGQQEADRLRDQYWRSHGTTLAGLMAEHHVDPHDFLDFVHDVEMDVLSCIFDLVCSFRPRRARRLFCRKNEDGRRVRRPSVLL